MQPRAAHPPPPPIVPTRDGYDLWAPHYDADDNPLVLLEDQHLPALLGDVRGLTIADIGCGTGRHAIRLARQGARVTALDFSQGMLDRAAQSAAAAGFGQGAIRFVQHDLVHPLPLSHFPSHSFDLVLSCLILDHIADLRLLMSEFARIARPPTPTSFSIHHSAFSPDSPVILTVMHPAMLLKGVQARFTDPATGAKRLLESVPNQINDYVNAAAAAGLHITHMSEHAPDEPFAARVPRAAKYLGWPMLLIMRLAPVQSATD